MTGISVELIDVSEGGDDELFVIENEAVILEPSDGVIVEEAKLDGNKMEKDGLENVVKKKKKTHICQECSHEFTRKSSLNKHITSVHLKIKNFKCSECPRAFAKAGNLKFHVDSVHLKIKKFKCSECSHEFTKKSSLNKHINSVHLKITHFKCSECPLEFTQAVNLKRHVDSVHLRMKKFKCTECPRAFARAGCLKSHLEAIHQISPKFKCSRCGLGFRTKKSLTAHESKQLNCATRHLRPALKTIKYEYRTISKKGKNYFAPFTQARMNSGVPVEVTEPSPTSLPVSYQSAYCGACDGFLYIIPNGHAERTKVVDAATSSAAICETPHIIEYVNGGYVFPELARDLVQNEVGVPPKFASRKTRHHLKQKDPDYVKTPKIDLLAKYEEYLQEEAENARVAAEKAEEEARVAAAEALKKSRLDALVALIKEEHSYAIPKSENAASNPHETSIERFSNGDVIIDGVLYSKKA